MNKILCIFFLLLSPSIFAEILKLECQSQSFGDYDFKTKKFTDFREDSYLKQDAYINIEEKWFVSRGLEIKDIWKYKFTEITEDYYYYSSEEDDEKKHGRIATAVKEGVKSIEKSLYYVKIDRYSLEWVDGIIYGEYFVKEQRFVPSRKDVNTFTCKKIKKQI
tara:strand:- start:76 stop:564 length:489 start_codon:yes stop_codon:yes gene_type:complete